MLRPLLFAVAALSLAACSPAADQPAAAPDAGPSLSVADGQVRASLGRNPNTAGYLTVTNAGQTADRLIGASCACADRVELHTMSTAGGIMRMSQVTGFDVPAGGALTLAPGGDHLMLLDLREPLVAGEQVRVTLTFARAGEMEVDLAVVTAPGGGHGDAHADHGDHGA